MKTYITIVASLSLLATGCASVTGSTSQNLSVQTRAPDGKEVKEAQCDMVNKRGTYFVTTPGTISISRSNDDLMITCRKDGYENGSASVVSAVKGSMFGNIILGGGIGAIVDHSNGSAYDYPSFVQVIMGSNQTIGKKPETASENSNPMMGAPRSANAARPSKSDRLEELKNLRDQGLIGEDVYISRQNEILADK